MYWELWDVGSRSRIADFASEEEALQAVREILAANRPDLIDDLTLVAMYDDGEARDIALPPALDGKTLSVRLAESEAPPARPSARGTMKVRIEDKEALEAISWESLKAYLDQSTDWTYAEDMPGKAAVYQHTDKSGRLWEIIVPLRRDLGDYVSRMADAVSLLARIEDRSELDVYDDLTNSPAEAAHKVHSRIRKWLAEEGWHIREVEAPETSFNLMATLPSGADVNIFQYRGHADQIILSQHLLYPPELRSALDQLLPGNKLQDLVWDIYRDTSIMGVEFSGLDTPSTEMTFRACVYFDGLTKDTFVQRALLTIRAVTLATRTMVRALETQIRTGNHAPSEEQLTKIRQLVPRPGSPATLAS